MTPPPDADPNAEAADEATPEAGGDTDPQQAGDEAEARELPTPTLSMHLFHLASQVSMALGEAENPMTGNREVDLQAARFIIDTLVMLEEKTAGNRSADEDQYMRGVLTNLRMAYVKKTGGDPE